jgi:hypothetical protein
LSAGDLHIWWQVIDHVAPHFSTLSAIQLAADRDHITGDNGIIVKIHLPTDDNYIPCNATVAHRSTAKDDQIAFQFCLFFNRHISAKDHQVT